MDDPMTPDLTDLTGLTASSPPAGGVDYAALAAALRGLDAAPEQSKIGQSMTDIGQGMTPRPLQTNAMAGKVVAPISPLQAAASGLQSYLSANEIGKGLQQQQQAAAAMAKGRAATQAFLGQLYTARLLRNGGGGGASPDMDQQPMSYDPASGDIDPGVDSDYSGMY